MATALLILNPNLKKMKAFKLKRFLQEILISRRNYSNKISQDQGSKWQSVIGLEVHAQINSNSKLFSTASTEFDAPPNKNVALFDCAMPGTLPVLNRRCVEAGVMTALALDCKVNPVSMFDRKHYFYSDLPAGFQITQQRTPLAVNGILEFHVLLPGKQKKCYRGKAGIKQIQLEQDSGRSLHVGDYSLIDLNRAGIPLMEIVFEPHLKNSDEAVALIKELSLILKSLDTCRCKMEEGELRVDVNVSVHKANEPLGVRSEIKNIGSIRGVAGAIDYEIQRQIEVLEGGDVVRNETRAWDAETKTTLPMRDKEEKTDYRYMPEPNLPLLHVGFSSMGHGTVNADELKKNIPPLPEEKRVNLQNQYALTPEQAIVLVNESALFNIFIDAIEGKTVDTPLLAKILINDFLKEVNERKLNLEELKNLKAEYFAEITDIVASGTINRNTAKDVISELLQGNPLSPSELVKEKKWEQIADENELTQLCREVILENSGAVEQYKAGKTKAFKALLGALASKTDQKADMGKCSKILRDMLKD